MDGLTLLTRGFIQGIAKAALQVPLTPYYGQDVLVKSLELPLPESATNAFGIHQSDIIIRTAITIGLADMRANPWLLDYVFASLPKDAVTWREYGEKSVQSAKDWFVKTDIPVVMYPNYNQGEFPCVTIKLMSSDELVSETTLGDIHYQPFEGNNRVWPVILGPFTPTEYDATSGKVTLGADLEFYPAVGMFLIDAIGRAFEIKEVDGKDVFYIDEGVIADFRNATIKPKPPSYQVALESSVFKEHYQIGCVVNGDVVKTTWLHSIVVFCLLRYKQALLEARGFERSTISSNSLDAYSSGDGSEILNARYINIHGYVRQSWPKTVAPSIQDVEILTESGVGGIIVDKADTVTKAGVNPRDALWVGPEDAYGDEDEDT